MKTNIFNSSLKNKIFDFINFKEAQGYKYTTEARRIKQFDKFLEAKTFNGKILTSEIVNDYISFLSEFSTNTKCGRFSLVKEFSSYLRIFCPESYLIVKNIFRSLPRKKSYIFTDKEINLLLRTAKKYQSSYPLFSVCNYTIIGLLAFTGIRLQECLNLNIDDWDNRRSQLFIKKGKFGKDRIIPLLPSVNSKINDYINKRCKYTALGDTNPLFINRSNKRVRQNDFRLFFNKLLDTLQIKNKGFTGRKPVVHSLRHTFAVKNIIKWLNSGKNINNMLPYLSTYMGHISISSTQVYLQSVEEIKAIGSEKFYCFFRNNI
jgi:integrase